MSAQRVLITGGSMGIGAAVARVLAQRGERVVLVARGREALETTRVDLPGEGHEVHALDVSDETGWRALAGGLGELHSWSAPPPCCEPVGPVGSYEPRHFRRALEINVVGTLLAIHHCPAGAARAGRDRDVQWRREHGAAAALRRLRRPKAAVARLSENLAIELAPAGVRVNCVAPGFVATRMHETTLAAGPAAAGADYYERTRRELAAGGFRPRRRRSSSASS